MNRVEARNPMNRVEALRGKIQADARNIEYLARLPRLQTSLCAVAVANCAARWLEARGYSGLNILAEGNLMWAASLWAEGAAPSR